jgi:hypothetical protein
MGPAKNVVWTAQLRSQRSLTDNDINKQSATWWTTIGGQATERGIGGCWWGRVGMEVGVVRMQDISANISSWTFALNAFWYTCP